MALTLLLALSAGIVSREATAHSEHFVLSVPGVADVLIDGLVNETEWSEATLIDLSDILGNGLATSLYVKHNDSFLFVGLDATGDQTDDPEDFSFIAFDTDHDGLTTSGREDVFYQSGFFSQSQAHLTFGGFGWFPHDSPYDTSLPNHAGLASAWGFGPSNLSATAHRQVEFRVPLALLGTAPGEVLGFVAAVGDYETGRSSFWPQFLLRIVLEEYGDLVLDTAAGSVDVRLLPPSQMQRALAGDSVSYQLNVTNKGTMGSDTFDLSVSSVWPVTLWDATGMTMLEDSDGDTLPDTGSLASGASLSFVARVEVPSNATGRHEGAVSATSSMDENVSARAVLVTELPPALFRPPHSDQGIDTDAPPDGLFNTLSVEANLTVVANGRYLVEGILHGENDTARISYGYSYSTLSAGNHTVALRFPGEDLYRSRMDGPYIVELFLTGETASLGRSVHTTGLYGYADFQKPAAVLAPPHSDAGLDIDGDGFFDQLAVDVRIEVVGGGTFHLYGELLGPVVGQISNLTALGPGNHTVRLEFDGRPIRASDIDGPYRVSLALYDGVTFEFLDRGTHTTASYGHHEFQAPRALFARPHADGGLDTDGDGLFNYLVVNATVNVTEGGMYRVLGILLGSYVDSASNTTTLAAGMRVVSLQFNGVKINASRVDGPYEIDLTLIDTDASEYLDAERHTTAAYSHLDFEEPPARFDPPHFDFGRDDDADGLHDFLVVNVTLAVDVAGTFAVEGILRDASSLLQTFGSNVSTLEPGRQSVHLSFPGPPINASDIDGPYTVDLTLYDLIGGLLLDTDVHTTAAYSHGAFDGPPGRFVRPHADYGLDTDADGLFNLLVVGATVLIEESLSVRVRGVLTDAFGSLLVYDTNVTSLDPGSHVVELAFDGVSVHMSSADGPYTVALRLYDATTHEFLDNDTHTTAGYAHTDFDGPPATLAGPHSDRGLDTDGDGLFNVLVVDVAVEVIDAGTFRVDGFFYDPTFAVTFFLTNTTDLDVGPRTVSLEVDGTRLNASGVDGPYTVDFTLVELPSFRYLGSGSHSTAGYAPTDFDGPEPLLVQPAEGTPSIDGSLTPGEWDDAAAVDLGALGGNAVPGFLLVKNDWHFLYLAYDATGDTTADENDVASIAFDTGHDGVASHGGEDQFVQGGWVSNEQAHYVYDTTSRAWREEDAPFDPGLPEHEGLASAWGFGSSDRSAASHRIYEFAIPLSLLDVTPGDSLGFFGGSNPAPGIFDGFTGGWSLWPFWNAGPLDLTEYGSLILATLVDVTPPTLTVDAPLSEVVESRDQARVSWSSNDEESGLARVEVRVDDGVPWVFPRTVTEHTFYGLSDGSHTVEVRAIDVVGNTREVSVNFTVDTLPPTVAIQTPGQGEFVNVSGVEISWSAKDATSGVGRLIVVLDAGPPVTLPSAASSHALEGLSEGSHTLQVQAVDRGGHVGSDSIDFVVDTVSPALSVSSPEGGAVVTTSSVEVTWLATDQTSGIDRFEFQVDGGLPQMLPSTAESHVQQDVGDGVHTLTVTAVDLAGNRASASVEVRVDTSFFSPTGPFGSGPLIALGMAASGAGVGLYLYLRGRKRIRP